MKIVNSVLSPRINNKAITVATNPESNLQSTDSVFQDERKFPHVNFGAMHPNFKSKKINIEEEKNKLIRKFDEHLITETESNSDPADLLLNSIISTLNRYRKRDEKLHQIYNDIATIVQNNQINSQKKLEALRALHKELKRIENNQTKKPQPKIKPKVDEKLDLNLLNKLKTSILEDDFQLKKVYDNYYADLNNISTVEELKEKYPKIKVPLRPELVIAKKIEESLSRGFYEHFDKLIQEKNQDEVIWMVNKKIIDTADYISVKYNIPFNETFDKLVNPTYNCIANHYRQLLSDGSFSKLPITVKDTIPKIMENEAKILLIDFDKFVLSVIRKQYIEGEKINNIVYEENGNTIQAGMLKEPEYKFGKPSEKIKKMINDAAEIHLAQRDYKNFAVNELKSRLEHFASSNAGNDEKILERIVEFDSCNFTQEDVTKLISFLEELDCLDDGNKSTQEVLNTVEKESLYPIGTKKLDEIEKQKATQKFHEEQQKRAVLKKLKKRFDDAINILYSNDLNGIANTCFKYRPTSLDENTVENAEFVINTVKNYVSEPKHLVSDKQALENKLISWDTFKYYLTHNSTNQTFIDAVEYGTQGNEFSQEKAGKYIINFEIAKNYPDSIQLVENPDILSKIIEKSNGNQKTAAIALCKYDDYCESNQSVKNSINKFSQFFDESDPAQKAILRYIVENEYVKSDTNVKALIRDNSSEHVDVVFKSAAKKSILDKYKYPLCMEFLKGFEAAMTSFVCPKGDSGIKKLDMNNKALQYKMEVKLVGHDDRLFSSLNDYCFDIYSSKGLH